MFNMELAVAPFMIPVAVGYAALCHFHRQTSWYIPNIVSLDEESTTTYRVIAEKGQFPLFKVIDNSNHVRYIFQGSKSSKSIFTFFEIEENGDHQIIGAVSAGIWSRVQILSPTKAQDMDELTQFAVGDIHIKHQSDAIDSYRLFELSNDDVYQWSSRGKFLEKVYNLGQKNSEIRERLAIVKTASDNKGYQITIDTEKISTSCALMTSMVSFLDQWSTILGVGGVYYPLKGFELPWRRV
ncbi:Conserved hypothetical protein [Geotrichum candidum]|uniref:Uncharacterized protein n=1 Tax=Geotrichum candidum TaxID=1173061 RepID=A0A0J9X8I5_GEOCN|nr:Conserved hypothetical protein [Geotrichum candidum]